MVELDYDHKIFTVEHNDLLLVVEIDENPLNPREAINDTEMLIWDNPTFLGDKTITRRVFNTMEEFKNCIDDENHEVNKNNIVLLPIYLDETANTISTENDSADKKHIGFIYITYENVEMTYGDLSSECIEAATAQLNSEIKEYNNYLHNNIYCYTIFEKEEGEDEFDNIVDGGGNYQAKDNISDTIKEVADHCYAEGNADYSELFDLLIAEIEKSRSSEMC